MYECVACMGVSTAGASGGQKWVLDPLKLKLHTCSCEQSCGYWELNSGPLQEQQVFLTTNPSLQSLFILLKDDGIPGSSRPGSNVMTDADLTSGLAMLL